MERPMPSMLQSRRRSSPIVPTGLHPRALGCADEGGATQGYRVSSRYLEEVVEERAGSIPHVLFIPRDPMLFQHGPELLLERFCSMVFFLPRDVSGDLLHVRPAD